MKSSEKHLQPRLCAITRTAVGSTGEYPTEFDFILNHSGTKEFKNKDL